MREEYDMRQLSDYLRQYAEDNLSWEKQMSPVVKWIMDKQQNSRYE